jgi:hypothetical protein
MQGFTDGNNPTALVPLDRKQRAITGDEKVCFRRKRSTYHNVVIRVLRAGG